MGWSTPYFYCSIFEGFFAIFHFSFIYFLIIQRYKNNRLFTSSFYLLYIVSGIISFIYIINEFYTWKLSRITAFRSFYESNPIFVTIAYLINGYTFHAICFCYTIISYNRYLMLRNSPTLKPVWDYSKTIKICFLMILFPFCIVAHRCFFPAKYIFDDSGTIQITHKDSNIGWITNLANVLFDFCNLLPTIVLNYFSYLKYKKLLKAKINKTSMNEAKLFFHSIYSCLSFAIVFAFEVAITFAKNQNFNEIVQYFIPLLITAYLLVGSLILLIISQPLRHSYFKFIGLTCIIQTLRNRKSHVTPGNWRSETY